MKSLKIWHWVCIGLTVGVLFFVVRYFILKRSQAITGNNGTGAANPVAGTSTVGRPLQG